MTVLLVGPFLATTLRFPVLVMEPGPAPDIADKSEVLASTYESEGSFHLTTVQIRRPDGSTLLEALKAMVGSDKFLVPRSAVYPSGGSDEQVNEMQSAQMVESGVSATAVAFAALGIEYEADGVLVADVLPASSVSEALKSGDLITAVDGRPVVGPDDLAHVLTGRRVGETVAVTLTRGSETLIEKVTILQDAAAGSAAIGIQISQHRRPPVDISFDAAEIGGPSAGLMFALSIYDRLEEGDLTSGNKIAGTGTVENVDGRGGVVGAVGAVELKVRAAMNIGADVFIVPEGSLQEARSVAGSSMNVIGVSTFEEAVSELEAL